MSPNPALLVLSQFNRCSASVVTTTLRCEGMQHAKFRLTLTFSEEVHVSVKSFVISSSAAVVLAVALPRLPPAQPSPQPRRPPPPQSTPPPNTRASTARNAPPPRDAPPR